MTDPVVLAVVAIVARVGQQLSRNVVRRLLPARRRHFVEPLERVLLQPRLVTDQPQGRAEQPVVAQPAGDLDRLFMRGR